ncbi:MAG TPA: ABC transporter permease, partial [Pseudonocardiaceae bacterium]
MSLTDEIAIVAEAPGEARPRGRWRALLAHPGAIFGIVVISVQVVMAVFAPWIAPHDPSHAYTNYVLTGPSSHFWFGTDELGRDVLSRVIFGARVSLQIAAICVGIAATAG